jgi:hypothetical protein
MEGTGVILWKSPYRASMVTDSEFDHTDLENSGPAGRVHCAISGHIDIHRLRPGPLEKTTRQQDTRWWRDGFRLFARGQVRHDTTPAGWEIFVFGEADCADLVADVAEEAIPRPGSDIRTLGTSAARRLCWGLLPSAAVIAVRPATQTVVLLRDGCGFRPLYYRTEQNRLLFSSNLGVIRAGAHGRGINTDKINEMLAFGHRTGNRTVWQGINVVAPGSLVAFGAKGQGRPEFFWTGDAMFEVAERERLQRQTQDDTLREVSEVIDDAMGGCASEPNVAVPGGGGVDSSFLGAYLARRSSTTFWCINQPEADRREQDWMEPLAKELAISCRYANLTRPTFLKQLIDYSFWA